MDKFEHIWWTFWGVIVFIIVLIGVIGGIAYFWESLSK